MRPLVLRVQPPAMPFYPDHDVMGQCRVTRALAATAQLPPDWNGERVDRGRGSADRGAQLADGVRSQWGRPADDDPIPGAIRPDG